MCVCLFLGFLSVLVSTGYLPVSAILCCLGLFLYCPCLEESERRKNETDVNGTFSNGHKLWEGKAVRMRKAKASFDF